MQRCSECVVGGERGGGDGIEKFLERISNDFTDSILNIYLSTHIQNNTHTIPKYNSVFQSSAVHCVAMWCKTIFPIVDNSIWRKPIRWHTIYSVPCTVRCCCIVWIKPIATIYNFNIEYWPIKPLILSLIVISIWVYKHNNQIIVIN